MRVSGITEAVALLAAACFAAPLEWEIPVEGPEQVILDVHDLWHYMNGALTEALPSQEVKIDFNQATNLTSRDIIGTDDRQIVHDPAYPWSAVGYISRNNTRCTATLVGPRIIATAAHCTRGEFPPFTTFTFVPAYNGTDQSPISRVIKVLSPGGYTGSSSVCYNKWDWAIMVLDRPIGNDHGWFGVREFDESLALQPRFITSGYLQQLYGNNTRRPSLYAQTDVTAQPRDLNCFNKGGIWTDADMEGGQLGGPLWLVKNHEAWIYGVASISSHVRTLFSCGREFVHAVLMARDQHQP